MTTPSGILTTVVTRRKIPKIVATYVYASSQGQRTHSARTNMKCPGVNQRTEADASRLGIQMALPMEPGSKMEF